MSIRGFSHCKENNLGGYYFALFRNGLAILSLKYSISGPIKKAVIIVPIPTIVGTSFREPPPRRKITVPAITHTRSVAIRQNLNLESFHLYASTMATASYVDTPRSAVM